MSSYERYRDVQSFWVSQVPDHWTTQKNKYVFTQKKETVGDQWENFTLLTMGKSGVKPRDMDGGGKFPESFENYQVVYPDQLIFCLFDLDETPRTVGKSDEHGMITSAYDVFHTRSNHDSQYWTYFYQTIDDHKGLKPYYTGLRKVVRYDTFMGIEVYSPPLEEQQLISSYLDKKTKQIDSLIEKTQKKIELLKEQRTSLINQCVTKGLDPNVDMKDSGVEWIGEIPSHWDVKKFSYVSKLETGNTPSKTLEELYFTEEDDGFPWVKPSDLDVGLHGVSKTESRLTEKGRLESRVVPKDSILVCCIGNTSGKYSIANVDLSTNQQINSITFDGTVLPRYGLFYMDVFGRDLLKWMNFVTLPIISKGDLSEQPVLVPPLEEQISISEFLDRHLDVHMEVMTKESQRIVLLTEYRQSLISSTVTGKFRVTEDMV